MKLIVSKSPLVTTPSLAVPLVSTIVPKAVAPSNTLDPETAIPPTAAIEISSADSLLAVICTSNLPPVQSASPSGSSAVAFVPSICTGLPLFWPSV